MVHPKGYRRTSKWPVGQVVKTAASHAAIRSSTLLRVTKKSLLFGAGYGMMVTVERTVRRRKRNLFLLLTFLSEK